MDKNSGIFGDRKEKLKQIMEDYRLEGILVYSNMLRRENIRYFTDFNPLEPDAVGLFLYSGESLLLVPTELEKARAKATAFTDQVISTNGDISRIAAILEKRKIHQSLGIGGWEYIPTHLVQEIKKFSYKIELVDVTPSIHHLRVIKSDDEIQKIQKAAQIAEKAFKYLMKNLRPGMKEYEVIAIIEHQIRQSHGEDNFQLLASSQGDSKAMHPASSKTLNHGDLFLTEISPQFEGYYAQICRTVVIGEISKERQKAYDIIFNAQQEAINYVRPGITASELAKIQNDVFREEGFAEYVSEKYTRGRGHGIGLYIDEEPLIAEGNDYLIKEGMVLMIHPNTYLPLSGYIVLGDPIFITANGGVRLTQSEQTLVSCQSDFETGISQ